MIESIKIIEKMISKLQSDRYAFTNNPPEYKVISGKIRVLNLAIKKIKAIQ